MPNQSRYFQYVPSAYRSETGLVLAEESVSVGDLSGFEVLSGGVSAGDLSRTVFTHVEGGAKLRGLGAGVSSSLLGVSIGLWLCVLFQHHLAAQG